MYVLASRNPEDVEGVELPPRRAKDAEVRGDGIDSACEIFDLGSALLRKPRSDPLEIANDRVEPRTESFERNAGSGRNPCAHDRHGWLMRVPSEVFRFVRYGSPPTRGYQR